METRKDKLESELQTLTQDLKTFDLYGGANGTISKLTRKMLEDKIEFYIKMLKEDYGKDFSHLLQRV